MAITLDHDVADPPAATGGPARGARVRGPVNASAELADEVARLVRLLRVAHSATEVLGAYLGVPLCREPRAADRLEPVCCHDSQLLDVAPQTMLTRRDGWLVPTIAGPPFRAAAISALVCEARLSPRQRAALRAGDVPLGVVLRDAVRSTHYAYSLATRPRDDYPVVHVRGTLLLAGVPVALVYETVLWRVVTHATARPPRTPWSSP